MWQRRVALAFPIIILIITLLGLLNALFLSSLESIELVIALLVSGILFAILIYAFIQIKDNKQRGYLIMFIYLLWQAGTTLTGDLVIIEIIALIFNGIGILLYGFLLQKMFLKKETLDKHE